jgi:hypothetical protein
LTGPPPIAAPQLKIPEQASRRGTVDLSRPAAGIESYTTLKHRAKLSYKETILITKIGNFQSKIVNDVPVHCVRVKKTQLFKIRLQTLF